MSERLALASVLVLVAGTDVIADPQIRVDAGMTASRSHVHDRSGGGFVAEIKNMMADNLAIGGRIEIALMFGGLVDNDVELDMAMAASALLETELFLLPGHVRPFVGFGIGAYTIGSQTVRSSDDSARIDHDTGRYLGIAPQIGVDFGRLRLAATYNAILGASLDLHRTVGGMQETTTVSQNYLSLELAFQFGGGRKQPPPPPPPAAYPPPAPYLPPAAPPAPQPTAPPGSAPAQPAPDA